MKFVALNKKGDVRTLAPTELVGYILAAVVFILILLVAGIFGTLYFSEKNEEFAVNNFIALANRIETLSRNENQFEVQKAFPFYLPPASVVVGFNRGWDNSKESDGCESEAVRKPDNKDGKEGKKCEDSACICLFGGDDDFMDGDEYNVELIQCRSLPEVDYIITLYMGNSHYNYPSEIWKNLAGERISLNDYSSIAFNDYAFFYIYGQCDDHYWDRNLKSRKLYIEKFKDNNNETYIFIAPEFDEEGGMVDEIFKRYSDMNEKYGKSETS